MKDFKKIAVSNKEVARFQENVEQSLKPLLSNPILDGVLLKDISLDSSINNKVPHKLGRKANGWIITRRNAGVVVWEDETLNTNPTRTILLKCATDVTIDIWIF